VLLVPVTAVTWRIRGIAARRLTRAETAAVPMPLPRAEGARLCDDLLTPRPLGPLFDLGRPVQLA